MKEKIKIILSIFLLVVILVIPLIIDARSGCCSHHGGVCGCRCCDGTPLSTTCAPYYPSCSNPAPEYSPPIEEEIIPKPESEIPKNNLPNSINDSNYAAELPKSDNNYFWWTIMGGLAIVGFITYLSLKRDK